jgi:hypothetical protein
MHSVSYLKTAKFSICFIGIMVKKTFFILFLFYILCIQGMMSQETLRMVYFAYVHSIMSYRIIFGGNQPHSEKIFKIQKRVIRIITNSRARDSCRELFKKLEILPLYSQYVFSLSVFVIKK